MATGGQFYWPPVGTFVAAYGQFFMAANTPGRSRATGSCGSSCANTWINAGARDRSVTGYALISPDSRKCTSCLRLSIKPYMGAEAWS